VDPTLAALIRGQEVATVPASETPSAAARAMAETGCGSLVVLDADGAPVGMLTDRDLALRVVARPSAEGPASELTVADVMTTPLSSVTDASTLDDVFRIMKRRGIRRVPVVRGDEVLGIVALDDLLRMLAREMDDLGKESHTSWRRARRSGALDRVQREVDEKLHEAYEGLQKANWYARDAFLHQLDEMRERLARMVSSED